jgi:TadE-like protein
VGTSSSRSLHCTLGLGFAAFSNSLLSAFEGAAESPHKRGNGSGFFYGSRQELDRDEVARRVEKAQGKTGQAHEDQAETGQGEKGQATVEFGLVLIALVSIVWALLSLCLIVRDQVLVTHASREAARTYAVTRSADAAANAARDRSGLGSELTVTVEPQPDNLARVKVSLSIASRIPIVGRLRPGLQLESSLITYVEPG